MSGLRMESGMGDWSQYFAPPSEEEQLKRLNDAGRGFPTARDLAARGYQFFDETVGAIPTIVGWAGMGANAAGYPSDPIQLENQAKLREFSKQYRDRLVAALRGDK